MTYQHLLTVASFILTITADFRVDLNKPVTQAFIDPIVANGKASGHSHDIFGSNAITENTKTADELEEGTCTTSFFPGDKSAYWFPSVFYDDVETGKTIRLITKASIYYTFGVHFDETILSPLIDGLQYLATPSKFGKTEHGPGFELAMGCLRATRENGDIYDAGLLSSEEVLPTHRFIHYEARLALPTCWNGELTSDDFHSHMAYHFPGFKAVVQKPAIEITPVGSTGKCITLNNGPAPALGPCSDASLFLQNTISIQIVA